MHIDQPPLELSNAVFGYDAHVVTKPISFTVNRGDVVALLGANGSGKSTIVRGVLRLAELLSGRVQLYGCDLQQFDEHQRVGYVPQRNTVAGALPSTVREVVTSGLLRSKRPFGTLRSADRESIAWALSTSGLSGMERRSIAELSGGQQRRVLIARALASQPELLILDEPTAGVDIEHQELLADTLAKLAEQGTTILLVAHELGPAEPIINRTLVMAGGALTYDGPPLPSHRHHDCVGEHLHPHGDETQDSPLGIDPW